MSENCLEIQLEDEVGRNIHFQPLQETLRGTLVFHRVAEPTAPHKLKAKYGVDSLPGQILGLDYGTKTGYVREPLRGSAYERFRDIIKKDGLEVGPELREHAG